MSKERRVKQTEQQKVLQEQHEREMYERAMWLGGVLEAGGSMRYRILKSNPEKPNKHVSPSIVIQDNDEERVIKLQQLFGGNIYKYKRRYQRSTEYELLEYSWHLEGSRAITLANAIQPYTPSRQEFMIIAQQWDDMTVQERVEAVEELKHEPSEKKREILDSNAYSSLVEQPQFVAGVIDSRGSMRKTTNRRKDYDYPDLSVCTANTPLLHALKGKFGGYIYTKPSELEKGVMLKVIHEQARTLYTFVKPHLLLRAEQAEQVFSQTQPRRTRRLPG